MNSQSSEENFLLLSLTNSCVKHGQDDDSLSQLVIGIREDICHLLVTMYEKILLIQYATKKLPTEKNILQNFGKKQSLLSKMYKLNSDLESERRFYGQTTV